MVSPYALLQMVTAHLSCIAFDASEKICLAGREQLALIPPIFRLSRSGPASEHAAHAAPAAL